VRYFGLAGDTPPRQFARMPGHGSKQAVRFKHGRRLDLDRFLAERHLARFRTASTMLVREGPPANSPTVSPSTMRMPNMLDMTSRAIIMADSPLLLGLRVRECIVSRALFS
jgi:hypothetical protein